MAKKVAMVLANNFEDSEAIDPKNHLESLGAEVVTIGEVRGTVEGKKGGVLEVERTFDEVTPDEFDMLIIPGGGARRICESSTRRWRSRGASSNPESRSARSATVHNCSSRPRCSMDAPLPA